MTYGNTVYRNMPDRGHLEVPIPKNVPAHIVLRQIHRLFSLLKRWAMGVYHGIRKRHADVYLQELVYGFNRPARQYRRKKLRRPVLARNRTAFEFHTH